MVDHRRLNVSITRSKFGLFIVGDSTALARNHNWKQLIKFYQKKNCIFEGEKYSNLVPMKVLNSEDEETTIQEYEDFSKKMNKGNTNDIPKWQFQKNMDDMKKHKRLIDCSVINPYYNLLK